MVGGKKRKLLLSPLLAPRSHPCSLAPNEPPKWFFTSYFYCNVLFSFSKHVTPFACLSYCARMQHTNKLDLNLSLNGDSRYWGPIVSVSAYHYDYQKLRKAYTGHQFGRLSFLLLKNGTSKFHPKCVAWVHLQVKMSEFLPHSSQGEHNHWMGEPALFTAR